MQVQLPLTAFDLSIVGIDGERHAAAGNWTLTVGAVGGPPGLFVLRSHVAAGAPAQRAHRGKVNAVRERSRARTCQ